MKLPRFLTLAVSLGAFISAHAESFTWQPTAGGTFTWTSPTTNWASVVSGTYPNQVGDVASVTTDLAGNQTISLNNAAITIGTLNIGDTGVGTTPNAYTLNTGTLIFAAAPGLSAAINVGNSGTAAVSHSINVGTVSLNSNLVVTMSGTFQNISFGSANTIVTNGNSITFNTPNTSSGGGASINLITGNGSLVKNGAGTMFANANNATYSGTVVVNAGRLTVQNTNGYLNSPTIIVNGGAVPGVSVSTGGSVLQLGNGSQAAPAGGRLNDAADVILRGGGFQYEGSSFVGVTSETFDSIRFDLGSSNILLQAGVGRESEIHLNTLERSSGATGMIRALNLATATGSGNSTRLYIADTTGLLVGGGGGPGTKNISIIPWLVGSGGGVSSNDPTGFVTYSANGLRVLDASEYGTVVSGTISTENLQVASISLSADSTYNSLKTSNSGISSISASGSARTLTITSGAVAFNLNGAGLQNGTLNFGAAEGIIYTANSNSNTISASIAGSGGLTKANPGLLLISGSNSVTGTVTVAGGTLRLGNVNALSINNDVVVANTSPNSNASGNPGTVTTLDVNGFNQTIRSLSGGGSFGGNVLLGSGTLTIGGSGTATYAGSISGSGALIKNGAGKQTLAGSSSYSGNTSVNLGTLLVNNTAGSATGSGAVTVGATGSTSYGTLGGGAGAATGGTLISLGGATKQVYAANAVGIIEGAVTVNQFGHLAPGNSVGTTTVGALTLDGGSVLDWEFNLNANDFVDVQVLAGSTGTLTFAGTTGINLYQEGTTTAFTTAGLYNLFGYDALSGFNAATSLSVLNADAGYTYTFINDTDNNLIQLNVAAIPEPGSLALIGLGAAMVFFRRRR